MPQGGTFAAEGGDEKARFRRCDQCDLAVLRTMVYQLQIFFTELKGVLLNETCCNFLHSGPVNKPIPGPIKRYSICSGLVSYDRFSFGTTVAQGFDAAELTWSFQKLHMTHGGNWIIGGDLCRGLIIRT